MPRILSPRKVPLKHKQIQERADRYKVTRSDIWIDPHPEVYGTKPEKMVYAELARRGVNFQYTPQINTGIPDLEVNQWFKPDFLVPQFKIIIEVQGAYWHTMPSRIADDSLRFALMQMAGYRVYPWWDYDIESRLMQLFDEIPELRGVVGNATNPGRSTFTDDLKGLRSANRKHRKPWRHKPVAEKHKHKDNTSKLSYIRERKPQRTTIL